jgi:acetyl-CoA C-acetyltransferase
VTLIDFSSPRRVAVVNSAQTLFAPAWPAQQHIDLIDEAVTRALKGTGLRIEDVDFVIDSGSDFLDGRSISNCGFLGAMGANHKEESRVEEDGLWSLSYAADKIAGGSASVGLVLAYSKASESDVRNYWTGLLEPFTQRPVGLDHLSAAGLYAQRYLGEAGLKAEDLAAVTDVAYERAGLNPWVRTHEGDADHWGERVATPLTRRDLAQPMDGAVAVLLATEEVARQVCERPVWLTGRASAIDQHFLAARAPHSLPACEVAAQRAISASGKQSAAEFDLVEVCGDSSVGELMVLEALGLAEPLKAIDLYRGDGFDGVNRSGGAIPADVIMASGLARLHEAATRLSGTHPSDEVEGRSALVHGSGGFAMQNHCVVTMEVEA